MGLGTGWAGAAHWSPTGFALRSSGLSLTSADGGWAAEMGGRNEDWGQDWRRPRGCGIPRVVPMGPIRRL